ncbi:Holliday junction DNA helicase RuvB [Microgenomates group bacterium RBG_16_45_19]|nr:MAG: Holliday junction DNA helicase RuvB [Microgenomates group bacterium RBG_16_45_19]
MKANENEEQEEKLYQSLRAESWQEFIGQEKVRQSVRLSIKAAKKRGEVLEHVLFYGPPGLGKTTLAHIIAREMGVNIRITSGPALERAGDMAAILTNLEAGDVLFVDEIHRLNRTVEETIYPAMEDYCIDVVLGKGPAARTLRLDLPKFTLIGATTQVGKLSGPLRDRFGMVYRLDFYSDAELARIVQQAAVKLQVKIDQDAAVMLASRSRKTARVALKLLKRVRDYAQVQSDGRIERGEVEQALAMLEVDDLGLDAGDRKLLVTIAEKFDGGPVGLNTLAASTAEDVGTIEDVYEPFLLRIGMLKRTPKGRVVTKKAYGHLGITIPKTTAEQMSLTGGD